jgi:SAM-dependent methyltransferase
VAATKQAEFDKFADDYQASLGLGVVISGEAPAYFAQRRVNWLARQLRDRNYQPRTILDFGCGTGTATPFLVEAFGVESVVGVDTSRKSLEVAKQTYSSEQARFCLLEEFRPNGQIDLVYCNGVFHHIPLPARNDSMHYICRSLRPGGYLGLWENNAWNPIARLLMWLGPVDRNAIPLTPARGRALAAANGFEVLGIDYLFIFPRWLQVLRRREDWVAQWPLGLQYQVLCRKPAVHGASVCQPEVTIPEKCEDRP